MTQGSLTILVLLLAEITQMSSQEYGFGDPGNMVVPSECCDFKPVIFENLQSVFRLVVVLSSVKHCLPEHAS